MLRHKPRRIPRWTARLAALPLALAAACSWTFDDSAPEVPLLGEAIPPERFPLLNVEAASDAILMADSDGNPWVAMPAAAPQTLVLPPPPMRATVHLLRLDAGAPSDGRERRELSAHHTAITYHAVYLFEPPTAADPTQPARVTVVFPALTPTAQMFSFPSGDESFFANSTDAVFAYWVPKAKDPRIFLTRTDGSSQLAVAPPKGYDVAATAAKIRLFFDRSGDRLFIYDGDGRLVVHSTQQDQAVDLGVQPQQFLIDSQQRYLVSCSEAGLNRVALDGSGATLLDPAPCNVDILRAAGPLLYFKSGEALHSVALDGSTPPQVALPGPIGQLLFVSSTWGLGYSLDSPLTYGSGIGDGWLGTWQFMQRGRRPIFSADGTRLRWLENAARSDSSGDLTSATVADHALLHIARNVRTVTELADGRILAISNAAFKGTQNRLIVIDEAARSARWVVDSARDFQPIPHTTDLLVKIVVGQLGYDIRRVPIPQ